MHFRDSTIHLQFPEDVLRNDYEATPEPPAETKLDKLVRERLVLDVAARLATGFYPDLERASIRVSCEDALEMMVRAATTAGSYPGTSGKPSGFSILSLKLASEEIVYGEDGKAPAVEAIARLLERGSHIRALYLNISFDGSVKPFSVIAAGLRRNRTLRSLMFTSCRLGEFGATLMLAAGLAEGSALRELVVEGDVFACEADARSVVLGLAGLAGGFGPGAALAREKNGLLVAVDEISSELPCFEDLDHESYVVVGKRCVCVMNVVETMATWGFYACERRAHAFDGMPTWVIL